MVDAAAPLLTVDLSISAGDQQQAGDELRADSIIPSVFNERVAKAVAAAVAEVAHPA